MRNQRALWSFVIVLAACSTPAVPHCTPGATQPCLCGVGIEGVQTCQGDGTFSTCDCTPMPDAGADAARPIDAFTPGDADLVDAGGAPPPRLVAPLSTSHVGPTPTLRWDLAAPGAMTHVEICADRACTTVEQSLDAAGASTTPSTPLAAGVHFWRARDASGTNFGPTWELFVAHGVGPTSPWGTVLDVNGDGIADVAVGSRGGNVTFVHYGGSAGPSATPDATLAGAESYAVASAGDVNGDGYADLALGSDFTHGHALVFLGGPGGIDPSSSIELARPATGTQAFGEAVTSAGDLDGDGYGDLVVADDAFGDGTTQPGALFVFLGSAAGPVSAASMTIVGPDGDLGELGVDLAGGGDLTGDGIPDVAVSAPGAGHVFVFAGGAGGLATTPTTTLVAPAGTTQFGSSLAIVGDVDGDGLVDLAVGQDDSAHQAVHVFVGHAGGPAASPSRTLTIAGSMELGRRVAAAGDVDGDGFDDLVAGDRGAMAVHLFRGSASGVLTTPQVLTRSDSFGGAVAGADVDGDGFSDVIASGHLAFYVFSGSASGLATTPTTITGAAGTSGYGWSIALATPARRTWRTR